MKRVISAILCLLMASSLLCACGKDVGEKTYTYKNISMTVPGDFEDVTEEYSDDILDFVVGKGVNLVLGVKLNDFTTEDYIESIASGLNLSVEPEERNGYVYLQYTYTANGLDYVYDVGLYEDKGDLWVIQVSALEKHYSKKQDMMLDILDSVTVK